MIYRFTGHPFVDAGIAGIAAILEHDESVIARPEDITQQNVLDAQMRLRRLYCTHIASKVGTEKMPLLQMLLQEVLPGSSWDQTKTGDDVAGAKIRKFEESLRRLVDAIEHPLTSICVIGGATAHVMADKSMIPMLASASERPNCYPDLQSGYCVSAWIALSVFFSPLSIEKTINDKGKGSTCLIYHSSDWRFMVEIAKRNLHNIQKMLSAASVDAFRGGYKKRGHEGSSKMALITLRLALHRVELGAKPEVVLWSFNANNQGGRYECAPVSPAFLVIHNSRRLAPDAYRQLRGCSDAVSDRILKGHPIIALSIHEKTKKTSKKAAILELRPGWKFQCLYAERVLDLPQRLLQAIERAAELLALDKQALDY